MYSNIWQHCHVTKGQSKATRMHFWMIQRAQKEVFSPFWNFDRLDQLDITYCDGTKCFSGFGSSLSLSLSLSFSLSYRRSSKVFACFVLHSKCSSFSPVCLFGTGPSKIQIYTIWWKFGKIVWLDLQLIPVSEHLLLKRPNVHNCSFRRLIFMNAFVCQRHVLNPTKLWLRYVDETSSIHQSSGWGMSTTRPRSTKALV